MQPIDEITPKLFNQVAQMGHFAAGVAIVFGLVVLFGEKSLLYDSIGLVVLAGAKELADQKIESGEVRGNGWEDFAFYCFGGAVAAILTSVRHLWM